MSNKFLNEAIIGNKNIVVSFTSKGELLRMYYPTKDSRQYVDYLHTGVKINDSNIIYLHDDINNVYKQYYDTDTNILNTEVENTYFNLRVLQTDFVSIKEDFLVKRYTFINNSTIDLDVNFLIHSGLLTDKNNFVGAKIIDKGLMQYSHDFTFSIFSKNCDLLSYQIHDSNSNFHTGVIQGKDYIGMTNDSSISYDIGTIKPNEKKVLDICIMIDEITDKNSLIDIENDIERIKKIDFSKEYSNVKSYWRKYVGAHNTINLKEPTNTYEERIQDIYKRSILLLPLLTNPKTGASVAAVEIDEDFKYCGRYAYCWPRDSIFVTHAMDLLKMEDDTTRFFKNFCKMTQSKNGMWEQRFFTDGRLAPCWGYQIDETAGVIFGVYAHYEIIKDEKFLKDTLKMCENACKFLVKYTKDVLEEKHEIHVSYDLWEMCEGIHLCSLVSIIAAFQSMEKIYKVLGKNVSNFENNRLKEEKIAKQISELNRLEIELKKYIDENMYSEEKKSYVRNAVDQKMDVSLLAAVVPFNVFSAKEVKMQNTVERINMTLRTYTGGYQRFEGDHYMNGNPWTIANLWMCLYYIEKGEKSKAKEAFDFVVKTSAKHGLLAEQVDNNTMKSSWVLGLAWAHALFVIVLERLFN